MTRAAGRAGCWPGAAVALAVAAFAAGTGAQGPSDGERIQNASCTTCHDVRPIDITALDQPGWLALVEAEIERGARVAPADVPVLVEYLFLNHGPLPDAPGKNILLSNCTICHDLRRVKLQGAGVEGWEDTLSAMFNEGAQLSDQEYSVLLEYLATYFGEF